MRSWARIFLIGLCLVGAGPAALAQNTVSQGGAISPGHLAVWAGNRTLRDGGGAQGSLTNTGIGELLQVNPLSPPGSGPDSTHNCFYDGAVSGPYHALCFDANALGGGLIDYGAFNGASVLPLQYKINGSIIPIAATVSMATDASNAALPTALTNLGLGTVSALAFGSLILGSPTGGNKGAGTFNSAGAVYDNGTAPTGVAGSGYVRATSPVLVTPALGTPSSGVATNLTGLPVTGLVGLGTGVMTFLATPSGANLASALTTPLPESRGGTGQTSLVSGLNTDLTPTNGNCITGNGGGTAWISATCPGGGATTITIATTTIGSGVSGRILYDNAGVLGEMTTTGSGTVAALATSPVFITPVLGAATATTINKLTLTQPAAGSTLTLADGKTVTHNATTTFAGVDGKTLTLNNSLTLAGTDSTVMTFPTSSKTVMASDYSNASTTLLGSTSLTMGSTNGAIAGLTGLAIRDTSAAFDVTLAGTSSTALSAGRTLTLDMKNVAHTLALNATANTITFPNTASYTLIGSQDSGTVTSGMLATPLNPTGGLQNNGVLLVSQTPPTIASGGCTTGSAQSISASNGSAAFEITLGGATCGTVIALTMPAAAHAWVCDAHNISTPTTNVLDMAPGGNTTSIGFLNFVRTTGVLGNFTGADHLAIKCTPY